MHLSAGTLSVHSSNSSFISGTSTLVSFGELFLFHLHGSHGVNSTLRVIVVCQRECLIGLKVGMWCAFLKTQESSVFTGSAVLVGLVWSFPLPEETISENETHERKKRQRPESGDKVWATGLSCSWSPEHP